MQGTLQSHNNSAEGIKSQPKLSLNSCVFSCCQKVKDETVRMAGGRLFHARDAATGKARSPRVDHCTDGSVTGQQASWW